MRDAADASAVFWATGGDASERRAAAPQAQRRGSADASPPPTLSPLASLPKPRTRPSLLTLQLEKQASARALSGAVGSVDEHLPDPAGSAAAASDAAAAGHSPASGRGSAPLAPAPSQQAAADDVPFWRRGVATPQGCAAAQPPPWATNFVCVEERVVDAPDAFCSHGAHASGSAPAADRAAGEGAGGSDTNTAAPLPVASAMPAREPAALSPRDTSATAQDVVAVPLPAADGAALSPPPAVPERPAAPLPPHAAPAPLATLADTLSLGGGSPAPAAAQPVDAAAAPPPPPELGSNPSDCGLRHIVFDSSAVDSAASNLLTPASPNAAVIAEMLRVQLHLPERPLRTGSAVDVDSATTAPRGSPAETAARRAAASGSQQPPQQQQQLPPLHADLLPHRANTASLGVETISDSPPDNESTRSPRAILRAMASGWHASVGVDADAGSAAPKQTAGTSSGGEAPPQRRIASCEPALFNNSDRPHVRGSSACHAHNSMPPVSAQERQGSAQGVAKASISSPPAHDTRESA